MMLELIICCFLVFAVAYWVTLWSAGRREDVLHGHFVEEPEANANAALAAAPAAAAPVFPKKPAPAVVAPPVPPTPVQPAASEQLQSLLVSIKSELKNAAQI
jgi:hypothetical protein